MKTVEALAQNIQQDPEKRFNELQDHMTFSFKQHSKSRDKKKSEWTAISNTSSDTYT